MDTSTWSPWPGPLTDWQTNWTPAEDDLPLPRSFLANDSWINQHPDRFFTSAPVP